MWKIIKNTVLVIFITNACQAANYYVDANFGADSNPGSVDKPFQTIMRAVEQIGAGDVVLLRGGVYREKISISSSGSTEMPITFKAYQSEHVLISGAVVVEGWDGPDSRGHLPCDSRYTSGYS